MNYQESLAYLDELNVFGMRLGLSRIKNLLSRMGNPQNQYRTIHVTGTNGKGSVSSLLAATLQRSGLRTGLYISPHLVSYTERVQVNGENISEADFAAELSTVRKEVEVMQAEGEECPTQFEVLTAMAFAYFASQGVDYAVIEVGLGGLLDSTNVIVPDLSVITNVTFEHAQYCGGTLAGIAHHKAGIIKEGVPVITAAEGEPLAIIRETAAEKKAKLFVEGEDFFVKGEKFSSAGQEFSFGQLGKPETSYRLHLLGAHQVKNAGLVVMASRLLAGRDARVSEAALTQALAQTSWPGRFEYLTLKGAEGGSQPAVIDGAHNPAGMTVLRKALDAYFGKAPRVLLLGILHDKEIDKMLGILLRPEDIVVMTPPQSDRAEKAQVLAKKAQEFSKQVYYREDNLAALKLARQLAAGERLLVLAGSLYLIGGLRDFLQKEASYGEKDKI